MHSIHHLLLGVGDVEALILDLRRREAERSSIRTCCAGCKRVFTLKELSKAISMLREEGIDGYIIGDTVLGLTMKKREFEGDVDLFTTSISPFVEEDLVRTIADKHGWTVGYTELGTPSITLRVNSNEIRVDLYENIMDFYIPLEALSMCRKSIVVESTEIRYVAVECWAVFKAKRGAMTDMNDLATLKQMVDEGVLKLDRSLLKSVIELYEDESRYIVDRLRSLGFKI